MTIKRKPPRARDRVLDGYAKQIRRFAKRTIDDVAKIADLLEKAKKRLPHGEFLPWTAREFGWSADTTERIRRAGKLLAKNRTLRHLNPSVLYELAKKSTPRAAVSAIAARVEAGETIRLPIVRQEVLKINRSAVRIETLPPLKIEAVGYVSEPRPTATPARPPTISEAERLARGLLDEARGLETGSLILAEIADRVPQNERKELIEVLDTLVQAVTQLRQALSKTARVVALTRARS